MLDTTCGAASRWHARLDLGFDVDQRGVTRLAERRHVGPLQVQRPFYPRADDACHVYLLHPPGGVVGGDRLCLNVALESRARVLLTTPAATKFYRSAGPSAEQTQLLNAAAGAALEWLPQETIVYDGARLLSTTRVELRGDARFIGWEVLCLGRPAASERFRRGRCRQGFELWRDGEPLLIDRADFRPDGDDAATAAGWGLRGLPVTALLAASAVDLPARLVDAARAALDRTLTAGELCGVSLLDGVLVCRYVGPSAARAKTLFALVWAALRPALLGAPATPPRVWNT